MHRWLIYSLITIVLFGFWGFVSTVVTRDVAPLTVQVLSTIGLLPVALVLAFSKNLYKGSNFGKGILFATATGVLGGGGNIAMYKALQLGGEGSAVVPLTGMYPLVTVALATFLLKERLNRIQTAGFGLALAAIYLFSPRESLGAAANWRSLFSAWMVYSLTALVLFGLSSICMKFATHHISDELSTIFYTLGYILIAAVIIAARFHRMAFVEEGVVSGNSGGPPDGLGDFDPLHRLPLGQGLGRDTSRRPLPPGDRGAGGALLERAFRSDQDCRDCAGAYGGSGLKHGGEIRAPVPTPLEP